VSAVPRALDALWQPLEIGTTTIRNRVMAGPTTLLYAEDNILSDRHIAFYEERARGGAGLLVTEEQGAYRDGIGAFPTACTVWEPRAVPQLAKLSEAVHRHGAKQFVQLYAAGAADSAAMRLDDWRPLWGASRMPEPGHNEIPSAMGPCEIAELVDGFAQSARHVASAGLDGVELHGAHGWLIGQFLSPIYNSRTDGYGGSVEARCRLALELGEAIRGAAPELTLGIQLSIDEYLGAAGITPADTERQLEVIAASGLFDYVNLSTGSPHSTHMTIPTMEVPEGYLAEHGLRAKELVGGRVKVVLAGRIRTLATAAELIEQGAADVVAMTRAQFADPWLVEKGMSGREREIVPCVGENECIVRAFSSRPVTCLMNPAMGREREWGERAFVRSPEVKRAVVVGGGPAGLKVAALAARRGHHVVLLEASDRLGGHLELLARLPHRTGWGDAVESLIRSARAAGAELRTGITATVDDVCALEPDVVACATGATWDRTGFSPGRPQLRRVPGAEGPGVIDIAAAIEAATADPGALGPSIVIVDESREYLPLGLADMVSAAGARVEIVTRHALVSELTQMALDGPHVLGRLAARDVTLTHGHWLDRIERNRVALTEAWSGRQRTIDGVSTVVLSMLRTASDSLYRSLSGRLPELILVGDALAPRRTVEVIYEGEKVGREL
jgi:2,4-dienoyl-CoA reductase-like NADH-dependent reductase (Old Yellow Enzyme family)